MKSYVCKSCGYSWQSANPALECAKFGCGSRLIAEASQQTGNRSVSCEYNRFSSANSVGSSANSVQLASGLAFYILEGIALFVFLIFIVSTVATS